MEAEYANSGPEIAKLGTEMAKLGPEIIDQFEAKSGKVGAINGLVEVKDG